jgi:hypothetical protein
LYTIPNGRVDLLTVNEVAWSQANMMVQFEDEILDMKERQRE